jgi:hypothetical protein
MNLSIFIKVLAALANFTDLTPEALALKQKLELYARDVEASVQLNRQIASSVCCDYETFNQVISFVSQCLTQGERQNIPSAVQHFERIAVESLPV